MSEEEEHSQENSPQKSEENAEEGGTPEDLIEQAGETIFQNVYKDVQNEIKDQIITKLLTKLEKQGKKVEELEKEIRKIKDDYIYVLKRILSNKNDYVLPNNTNNSNNKSVHFSNDNSSRLNNSGILTHKKNHATISEDWDASEEESVEYKNKHEKNIETKIKRYLNNLNKVNYVNNTEGTSTNHYIEKDIAIYDELFPKKASMGGINSSFEGSVPETKRNASVKNRKPKISLYFKEYKNSILDKKEDSSRKYRATSKKKIKIYKGGNNSGLKNTNTTRNKHKNNNSYFTTEEKRSTEKKNLSKHSRDTRDNRGNYHKKVNVVNSNDPNRKLKLNYAFGNKGHVYNLAKQSTK